ncbi:MAG TPA: ScyD/ScyE family protein, partial [Thermomicrobiales bacterium]|nr:ScyD/ScyE family protein [Thermomicrobiales bacterium]
MPNSADRDGLATRSRDEGALTRRRLLQAGAITLAGTAVAAGGEGSRAEPIRAIALAASGLTDPRGMAWDAAGALYVAQAGTGDAKTATGAAASVVKIVDGCPAPFATGLPSTAGMSGHIQGPSGLAFLGDTLYILQDSQDDRGDLLPTFPNGVYAVTPEGGVRLVADISTWMIANPTKEIPYDRGKLGETFAMMAGDGFLWVVESNEGQVLKVTPDGGIARFVDLSEGHPVPTGIAPAPDGGVYIGNLTAAPYPNGAAKVLHVHPDGSVETVWTGLTAITALAVGADGALYALEMSSGNVTREPFVRPRSGRVVKQIAPNQFREVISNLDFPISMAFGPDGALFVSDYALGLGGPSGAILRVEPGSAFLTPPGDVFARSTCSGFADARMALTTQENKSVSVQVMAPATPSPTLPANA